jgi:tRNA (cytidine/uridine-2'-O-)-methyltransferase
VLHIVLVQPVIPWNTGNVGRTCLALGAQLHLVGPLGFTISDRQVRRAGLDYWPAVAPVSWDSWAAFERALPTLGEAVIVSPDGASSLWASTLADTRVLIFGSETDGLPSEVRRAYRERSLYVPMRANSVRSLNLSTCVAVVAYEVLRQGDLRARLQAIEQP